MSHHSNPATVIVTQGDNNVFIATNSRLGEATMQRFLVAIRALPGVANIARLPQPGTIAFTLAEPATAEELSEELTSWLYGH